MTIDIDIDEPVDNITITNVDDDGFFELIVYGEDGEKLVQCKAKTLYGEFLRNPTANYDISFENKITSDVWLMNGSLVTKMDD